MLTTGRSLFHFNAGTMTGRSAVGGLRPANRVEISPEDADRLGVAEDELVRMRSRWGSAIAHAHRDASVKPGEVYASFHAQEVELNRLTGNGRDCATMTPEYKRTAVCLEKLA